MAEVLAISACLSWAVGSTCVCGFSPPSSSAHNCTQSSEECLSGAEPHINEVTARRSVTLNIDTLRLDLLSSSSNQYTRVLVSVCVCVDITMQCVSSDKERPSWAEQTQHGLFSTQQRTIKCPHGGSPLLSQSQPQYSGSVTKNEQKFMIGVYWEAWRTVCDPLCWNVNCNFFFFYSRFIFGLCSSPCASL